MKIVLMLLGLTQALAACPSGSVFSDCTCPSGTAFADCVTGKSSFYGTNPSTSVYGCINSHIGGNGWMSITEHNNAVPTSTQATDWGKAAQAMLYATGSCRNTSYTLPSTLAPYYDIVEYYDQSTNPGVYFCLLVEKCTIVSGTTTNGKWYKGWGLFATPRTFYPASGINVHVQATHPIADANTDFQAAFLFRYNRARSLLIATTHRTAIVDSVVPNTCSYSSDGYGWWDASHANYLPFNKASQRVSDYLDLAGGCPDSSCAVVQFHGKSSTSCSAANAFISIGYYDAATSTLFPKYTYSSTGNYRHYRLKTALTAKGWTAGNPTTNPSQGSGSDSSCELVAAKNVQGRRINGVALVDLCCDNSTVAQPYCNVYPSTPTGTPPYFLHIEQASTLRDPANAVTGTYGSQTPNLASVYGKWYEVMNSVF